MEEMEEACFTGLSLGLGLKDYCLTTIPTKMKREADRGSSINRRDEMCMVTLGLSTTPFPEEDEGEEDPMDIGGRESPQGMKAHPETCDSINGVTTSNSESRNHNGRRKKLRLSKDQSALLEDSFKIHRTLTPTHKQALADKLKLKPRQVEVWFQNRRARSKLKQIESDFERLKKKCESLSQRNQRLEKELHELRSMKDEQWVSYASRISDLCPEVLSLCSSCRKITGGRHG
ncbi:hypothetical protein SAY86_027598 [Trapa natans]|uniref:Homeobox domain-containing protein n=1 Tax=Trapa natans TaxID=22666 RepID=A0AAN7KRR9_TRANT|nr:hypothetical protein SAY86_027598 [Trapa natans]